MTPRPLATFTRLVPRQGGTLDECEDRLAVSASRFAVADGASEAIYADVWADMLVTAFCATTSSGDGEQLPWLTDSRTRWREWTRSIALDALPWFTREKLRAGSFATFAGLAFDALARPADTGSVDAALTWTAVACGDACAFLVRGGELALSFPLAADEAFGNSPALLSTDEITPPVRLVGGRVERGDRFYLATDALAQWLLAEHARGARPWDAIEAIQLPDVFDALVDDARRSGALRNDDVSFVAVAVE